MRRKKKRLEVKNHSGKRVNKSTRDVGDERIMNTKKYRNRKIFEKRRAKIRSRE